MKTYIPFLVLSITASVAGLSIPLAAAETGAKAKPGAKVEMKLAALDPLVVDAPQGWTLAEMSVPGVPMKTSLISAPGDRNVKVMISVIARDRENFAKVETLKQMLRRDISPYLSEPGDEEKMPIKALKIQGGLCFYVDCTLPAEESVKMGGVKTMTWAAIGIGKVCLISGSFSCDDLKGMEHQEALQLIASIRVKK